jgi:Na+-driven multidrug efflux pump
VAYTRIIALGMPFYVISSGGSMFIKADGSPKYAMVSTVFGAVLNMILDPIFIFTLDMGIQGAAIATIVGQIVSGVMTAVYFRHFKTIHLERSFFKPERKPAFL